MLKPSLCRPEAFEYFAEQFSTLETTSSLIRAAVAVSMHALDDVKPEEVELRIMALSARVAARYHASDVDTVLAHLHHTLFEEEGYGGDQCVYDQPLSSYLPAVLQTKRGLPIVLSLIYKAVGEQLGLRIEGVNAPYHFLVRVATPSNWLLIDPFNRGSVLTRDEAFDRIDLVSSQRRDGVVRPPVDRSRDSLKKASHADWLRRLLHNLQHVLAEHHRLDDLAAMNELQQLLHAEFF